LVNGVAPLSRFFLLWFLFPWLFHVVRSELGPCLKLNSGGYGFGSFFFLSHFLVRHFFSSFFLRSAFQFPVFFLVVAPFD